MYREITTGFPVWCNSVTDLNFAWPACATVLNDQGACWDFLNSQCRCCRCTLQASMASSAKCSRFESPRDNTAAVHSFFSGSCTIV